MVLDALPAEVVLLEAVHADQVSADELLPVEATELEVFTAGLEVTQTWVEVTVGWQSTGSHAAQVEEVEAEEEAVELTGLLLVVEVDHSDQVLAELEAVEETGLVVVLLALVHWDQVFGSSDLLELIEALELVHSDQVLAELLEELLLEEVDWTGLVVVLELVHADHVGSTVVLVVGAAVVELLHCSHAPEEATADAEAAPAKAAAAMTDFILIVGWLGTRKSDYGQILL